MREASVASLLAWLQGGTPTLWGHRTQCDSGLTRRFQHGHEVYMEFQGLSASTEMGIQAPPVETCGVWNTWTAHILKEVKKGPGGQMNTLGRGR